MIATALALALTSLGLAAPGSSARAGKTAQQSSAAVPPAFVGVDVDGPLVLSDPPTSLNFGTQFNDMVAAGIGSVRVAFNWAAAQPYQSWSDVPADQLSKFTNADGTTGAQTGVPTDFSQTDQLVGLAGQRGMTVLPTVLYAPGWDGTPTSGPIEYPTNPGPYAAYLTALIHRYGPHGTFWSANPTIRRMPIRMWQIWNEEQLSYYWRQPFVSSYLALLRASRRAIKSADRGAKVVLGALTNTAWATIGKLYRKGARKLFDIVSVNAFTKKPANVILYLRLVRRAMDHFKDNTKPLMATELSWPSSRGQTVSHFDWDTTPAGQARNISTLLPLLGENRSVLRLQAFYYYTWMGVEQRGAPDFAFAGLEGMNSAGSVFAKPALGAFRRGALALERCKVKSSQATRCAKRAR